MSSTTGRVWATVKPHVPLIRFRKGGKQPLHSTAAMPAAANLAQVNTTATKASSVKESVNVNSLPKRFMRKPMTDLEMQAIEMGGLKAL